MNDNNKKPSIHISRQFALGVLVTLLFALITWRLMDLQLRDGQNYAVQSETTKNRTVSIKGMRGRITDTNGIPLAYDKESFDVTFYKDSTKKLKNYEYTEIFSRVIELVEKNNGQTVKSFALSLTTEGVWKLDFSTQDPETFKSREELWRKNMYVTDIPEYELYEKLRANYGIPEELDYEASIKLLAIWQEVQMNAYFLTPTPIAKDVSMQTVAEIEARIMTLTGIDIAEGTVRVYPRGIQAGNIIGYTGKMTDKATIEEYRAKGYAATDLIGVTGIEKTMEDHLTGNVKFRQGSREVEVDSQRRITRELNYTAPLNGNNVMLTIDLNMQQVLEASLERAVLSARDKQLQQYESSLTSDPVKRKEYDDFLEQYKRPLRLAQSGAAVVMDVHTGNVLAMSTYPSYDPGLFVGGISAADFDLLLNDPATPLFNKAIQSRSTPGSVFKMVTSLAGLMEGVITVEEEIPDMGEYNKNIKSGRGPRCWRWPNFHLHQEHNNLVYALERSCNYYFYEVADRLGAERLSKWGALLGLTSKTGIELPSESTSVIGSQTALYDPARPPSSQRSGKAAVIYNAVVSEFRKVGQDLGIAYDEERLDRLTVELMKTWREQYNFDDNSKAIASVRALIMEELSISSEEIRRRYLINTITGYLNEIIWTANQTVMTGIGQSITEITPIAMARYISTIANGGTVYEAHIVDKVVSPDGQVVLQKEPVVAMEMPDISAELEVIRVGMRGVIGDEEAGTAQDEFKNYPYKNDMGAKTGTAQTGTIDIENNAWFVAFAPFDEPQIAIVAYIPNGYKAIHASPVIKDIVTYYFEAGAAVYQDAIPIPNTVIP